MAGNHSDVAELDMELRQPQHSAMEAFSRKDYLQARLYSYAPLVTKINAEALVFRGLTRSQVKRLRTPIGPHVEPLVKLGASKNVIVKATHTVCACGHTYTHNSTHTHHTRKHTHMRTDTYSKESTHTHTTYTRVQNLL